MIRDQTANHLAWIDECLLKCGIPLVRTRNSDLEFRGEVVLQDPKVCEDARVELLRDGYDHSSRAISRCIPLYTSFGLRASPTSSL